MINFIDPLAELMGSWSYEITVYSIIFRVLIALIMGSFMGYERAVTGQVAGLRTYILIALAGVTTALLDTAYSELYILSGITILAVALIGTSSITMTSKNRIKGLTSTMGQLAIASLSISVGVGGYTMTIIGIIALVIAFTILGPIEGHLKEKSSHMLIHLELKNRDALPDFTKTIRKLGMTISEIEANRAYVNTDLAVYTMSIELNNKNVLIYKKHKDIIEALMTLDYVIYMEELI